MKDASTVAVENDIQNFNHASIFYESAANNLRIAKKFLLNVPSTANAVAFSDQMIDDLNESVASLRHGIKELGRIKNLIENCPDEESLDKLKQSLPKEIFRDNE